MNTELTAVTFTVQVQKPYMSDRLMAYAFDNHQYIAGGKYADNRQDAIISLYWNMTENFYSFKLLVMGEDNEQVVQELSYSERH